jgi:ATP-dependent DNA helicase RecG
MSFPLFHPESRAAAPLALSGQEFARAFPEESQHVEFKRGVGRPVQDSIVAFSNAEGGLVIVGVDDDGAVIGRDLTQGLQDDLHRLLATVRDPGRYSFHRLPVDDVPVSIVAVASRREGFAQTSEGRVLVRRGTRDEPVFGDQLRRLVNERALARYEESVTDVELDAIDGERWAALATTLEWAAADGREDRLVERGLARHEDGLRLTVAGVLVLLARPDERLGKASIEVLRFEDAGPDYDRRVEITGPVDVQVARATELVFDELGTEMIVLGHRRHDLPRIPIVVLREAVANAVAHRSYELGGSAIRIEIRPDAVTVTSPGGLPEPVTEENIRVAQAARNLDVIRVLRQLGLAEDAGRGVDVMEDSMRDEMLDPPRFEDLGHAVRVTLPIRSAVAPEERAWVQEIQRRGSLEPRDRVLVVHAARGEVLTNARARELLGADSREARAALRRLRDQGLLLQEGERGGATYAISDTLAPPAGLRLSRAELADLVIELARDGPVTNARVRERTGLDRVETLRVLGGLVREGRIERVGRRRGTRYVLPGAR